MPVASTASWTLDTDELISAAMERLRRPADAGYDITVARRAIQFVLAKLTTRGINLHTVELQQLTLPLGVIRHELAADTEDVLEVTYRDTGLGSGLSDIRVARVGRDQYHFMPDKDTPGPPVHFYLDRQRDFPILYLWPAPDRATYRLDYYRIRRFRDVGQMTDNLDVRNKWLGLMVAGVAMYIGKNLPDLTPDHRAELRQDWLDELDDILPEDRDRADLVLGYDLSCYARI